MLTPQEIQEKTFKKIMYGYDMNAVDSFRESVTADYTQLYKENIALKSKMKVLIAKIEEYRSVDDSMRKALLNAQTMASKMVEEAKADIENRERMASDRMDEKLRELRVKVEEEEQRFKAAEERANNYIEHLCESYRKEIEKLQSLKQGEIPTENEFTPIVEVEAEEKVEEQNVIPDTVPLPFVPPAVEIAADKIEDDDADMKVFEVDLGDAPAEKPEVKSRPQPVYKSVVEDDEETITLTPKPRFEFSNLQFGDKYDPTKKSKK